MITYKVNIKIVLLVLFLEFIIFVGSLFATEEKKAEALKKMETEEYISPAITAIQRPSVFYSGENLRDPFLTALPQELSTVIQDKEQVKLPDLTIQGIILGPRFSQVIINNKVLRVGEQVSNVSVSSIAKDEVSVLFDGKYYVLVAPAAVTKNSYTQGGKK